MLNVENSLELKSADATEVSLPLAGIGARSYAFIIDWHIRVILSLAWLAGVLALLYFLQQTGLADILEWRWTFWTYFTVLPTAAIYLLYHPVLEVVMKGRTPGKRKAGIRIVSTEGHTPGTGPILVRNVFRLVDSLPMLYVLGLVVMSLTPRQVRIGDLAAGTLMVYEQDLKPATFSELADTNRVRNLQQLELAEELLERWRQLDARKRARLARELLARLGEDAAGLSDDELPAALRRAVDGPPRS